MWVFVTIRVQADTTSHEVIFRGKVEIVSNELRELGTYSVISNLHTQFPCCSMILSVRLVCVSAACWLCIFLLFVRIDNGRMVHREKKQKTNAIRSSHASITAWRLGKYGKELSFTKRYTVKSQFVTSMKETKRKEYRDCNHERGRTHISSPTKQHNIRSREACRTERNVGNRQPPTSLAVFFKKKVTKRNFKTSKCNDFLSSLSDSNLLSTLCSLFQGREVYTLTVCLLFSVLTFRFVFVL